MNCPICDNELEIDNRNKWIICKTGWHKFKVTDWDDVTVKHISLKILSDSVMMIKSILDNPESILDEKQRAHLDGQISAFRGISDFLRERF